MAPRRTGERMIVGEVKPSSVPKRVVSSSFSAKAAIIGRVVAVNVEGIPIRSKTGMYKHL